MKQKKKQETNKQIYRRETREFLSSLQGKTQEEKIALNKAMVAKHHPEPDLTSLSSAFARRLRKLRH